MRKPSADCSAEDPRLVGDPVDTLTGAVTDRKLEFRLIGPLELGWWRYYDSSQCHRSLALGWGHTHVFDRRLTLDERGVTYEEPVGRSCKFPHPMSDGERVALHGLTLRRLPGGRYRLERHGEPAMEFDFQRAQSSARLTRLVEDVHQIRFLYDDSGLIKIVDSMQRCISVHESQGRLISLTLDATADSAARLLIHYSYDAAGNLVRTRNAAGHGYEFVYDDNNRMRRRIGRKGFTFQYKYDDRGRCIRSMGDDRLYGVALDYQVPGRMTKVTRPDGGVWTYMFDDQGALAKIIDPLGSTQRFVRDTSGRIVMEYDANNNATRTFYDESGAATSTVDSLGHYTRLPADPNARAPWAYRVAATALEYEYGLLLNNTRIAVPARHELATLPIPAHARDLAFCVEPGTPTAQILPFEVKPLGVHWWPDPMQGRMFNDLGKLVEQRDAFGHSRIWRYDASGNVEQYRDFDGGTWTYDYGSWHLLRGLTNPLGDVSRFTYGSNGKLESSVDAAGNRSEYRYDLRDLLIEVRRHDAVRDSYVRDAGGNIITKEGKDGRPLLRMEYGIGNLRTRVELASGDVHTFEYDQWGRELVAATGRDRIELAYDGHGNRSVDKRNGAGMVASFLDTGRLLQAQLFERFTVRYQQLPNNVVAITDPGGVTHHLRVLERHGMVVRRFSSGAVEASQYDPSGRCLFKSMARADGAGLPWQRRYHWSGEGQLQRVEDSRHGEVRHQYDAAGRLQRRTVAGTNETYHLDSADNLLSQPGLSDVAFDAGNRIKAANDWRFSHDDRNHVAARASKESRQRFVYDSCDQLIEVETPQGTWRAEYDAFGRRTRKMWAGLTTEFYWNLDQLVAEVHADGRVRLYVYPHPLALTPLLFLDYASLDAAPESGVRYFVFSDQLGTPVLIEDEQGREVWQARIKPFGQAELTGTRIEFNLRFPGHYYDAELGLHYNRFRYYDPQLGRYLQSDPWGISGGMNLYAYRTNPLASVDVRGLGEGNRDPADADADPNQPGRPHAEGADPAVPPMPNATDLAAMRRRLAAQTRAEAQRRTTRQNPGESDADYRARQREQTQRRNNEQEGRSDGPVLTGVIDPRYPDDGPFYGTNTPGREPETLQPPLAARRQGHIDDVDAGRTEVTPQAASRNAHPADHSETSAANQALENRARRTGRPTTEADLAEMQAHNTNIQPQYNGPDNPKIPPAQGCPGRCDHCQGITGPRSSGPGMTMVGPDGTPQPR